MMCTHRGQCHCGAIQFEVDADDDITVYHCNCSICTMTGFQHLICPKTKFRLLQGEADLSTYRFNTGVAQHLFCKHCGIKPFYVPRSNPDGYSVNLRCLDQSRFKKIHFESFDGQNWEQSGQSLAHLSQD